MNKSVIFSSNTSIILCLTRSTRQLLHIERVENLLYSLVFSIQIQALLQHFPRAGDLAEMMDFYLRRFYARLLPWLGWGYFLLQVLPDSEFQSVLAQQRALTSQVSPLKLVPRKVLEKSLEQVHISEPDSKGRSAFFAGPCRTVSSVRDAQYNRQQLHTTTVPYFAGPE